jgi:AAA family ATPase
MTAQAVANTYGLNFLAVKGAELISMYVGESERAVREIFRKARAAAPSIIFFDEIDAIGASRDSGGSSGLNVLTTLLNEMDGFEQLKGVQVLAATNKPESLDPALLRPGRFDAHVYLGPPSASARLDILKIGTKGLQLRDDVRLEELVEQIEGYSGAEIKSACDHQACHYGWCDGRKPVQGGPRNRVQEYAEGYHGGNAGGV